MYKKLIRQLKLDVTGDATISLFFPYITNAKLKGYIDAVLQLYERADPKEAEVTRSLRKDKLWNFTFTQEKVSEIVEADLSGLKDDDKLVASALKFFVIMDFCNSIIIYGIDGLKKERVSTAVKLRHRRFVENAPTIMQNILAGQANFTSADVAVIKTAVKRMYQAHKDDKDDIKVFRNAY